MNVKVEIHHLTRTGVAGDTRGLQLVDVSAFKR